MKSMLQVPLKPEVLHEIKVIAVEKETTLTNVVRESLLEYIAKNKHLLANGVRERFHSAMRFFILPSDFI
jgi:hypothetical protein